MAATVAGRPYNDYADNWCSLFELFVSVSGLKLRINIPDTVVVKDGRMLGWFYTNKEGVICRCALHEIGPTALFQKLVGSATLDEQANPYGYVALCHFESGVSRPLKQQELQHLLSELVGPYEQPKLPLDPGADIPFCIQAYIIPHRDLRYLATYGGTDQPSCTVFGRRFSSRYSHVSDPSLPPQLFPSSSGIGETGALTSEELVVESQLVALGLLEPRTRPGDEEDAADLGQGSRRTLDTPDTVFPAPKAAKAEIATQLQSIVSYVERSHGLRIQGLVTEFVQAHSQVFVLMAVHAVQWDGRASRGRLGTFTERWQDFTAGLGPAPAAQPPSRHSNTPGLLLANDGNSLIMTERSAGPATASQVLNTASVDYSPLRLSQGEGWAHRASLGRSPHLSMHAGGLHDVSTSRPGSAPAQIAQRFRIPYTNGFPGPRNGHSTVRNALASARRGAGGNPSSTAPAVDSYALFTPREHLSTDTIAGTLVLEVEILKERLQRQADIAARAETALTQVALSSQTTQQGLLKQLQEAKAQTEAAHNARVHVEAEYERLRAERAQFSAQITALEREAQAARSALQEDRATLASTVRTAAEKEEGLEDLCNRLRTENEELTLQVSQLQRRLEEESEVVEAARNQLYDYRQMVGQLQNQLRRGKNKPVAGAGPGIGFSSSGGALSPVAGQGVSTAGALPTYNPRMSQSQYLPDFDAQSDQGTAGGPAPTAGPAGLKAAQKRPGNSPLNKQTGRTLDKSITAPSRRVSLDIRQPRASDSQGFGPPHVNIPPPNQPHPIQHPAAAEASAAHSTAAIKSPRGDSNHNYRSNPPQQLFVPQITHLGGVTPIPTTVSPRSQAPSRMATPVPLPPGAEMNTIVMTLFAPPDDPIAALIAELRQARKYGHNDGNPFLLALSGDEPKKETPSARNPDGSKAVVTMKAKKEKITNPWKPNYDALHLNDLFILTGEMTERMTETLLHTITLLKSLEQELLEIYNYYACLGQVRYIDHKLIMVQHQFIKLAKFTGLAHEQHGLEVIEDVFSLIAERVTSYYSEFKPKHEFITFHEFPEAVCRLAAARYDWRPPESPDEADDDIEQPEMLRTIPLANISELPNANQYGVGPTTKISSKEADKEIVREFKGTRPRSAAAIRPPEPDDGCEVTALSVLGPQPPDIVLYTIIKTYLLRDLLPNVKRNKGSSSKLSKAKIGTRTAPENVWT